MAGSLATLRAFLDAHPACAVVEVAEAKGSTPREQGAWMLVAPNAIFGTIGGGQLEWMAIDEARALLPRRGQTASFEAAEQLERDSPTPSRLRRSTSPSGEGRGKLKLDGPSALPFPREGGEVDRKAGRSGGTTSTTARYRQGSTPPRFSHTAEQQLPSKAEAHDADPVESAHLDIPLGPEIGQCCGGRVKLSIQLVGDALRDGLLGEAEAQDAARPSVLVFGAGHVGHALADALALLPVRATVVETRGEALKGLHRGVQSRLTPVPEETVRSALPGTAFVILTHDHALDFLLAAEALKRGDAAYVGMIGSKTKRATFRRWFLSEADGTEAQFARLLCPIGGSTVPDKRPAVIAALAAAELVAALLVQPVTATSFAHKAEG